VLTSAIAAGAFLTFLALGAWVVDGRRGDASGTRTPPRVSVLILYVVAVSLTSVLSRHDLWPFSAWSLMAGTAPEAVGENPPGDVVIVVDARGNEFEVDYRAWEPFTVEELDTWLPHLADLDDASKARAAADLLARANVARERVLAGKSPGYFDRWLGPLTAPHHFLHPAIWTQPDDVPREPFVVFRVYREFWQPEARRRDATTVRRTLVYEYQAARSR